MATSYVFDERSAQRIAATVRAMERLQGRYPLVRRTRSWRVAGGGGATLARYRVIEIADDYLRCHTWDGITEGADDVYVAKPLLLRHNVANYSLIQELTTEDTQAVRVRYTADLGAPDNYIEELWKVRPDYSPGDPAADPPKPAHEIVAAEVGATGVTWPNPGDPGAEPPIPPSDDPITLLDLNVDARAWGLELDV